MKNIDLSKVFKVYSGKPGCMCGCRGNYRVASAHQEFSNKERGYDYDEKEISDRSVKRIVNLLEQAFEQGEQVEYEDHSDKVGCFFLETPARVYVAYVLKA